MFLFICTVFPILFMNVAAVADNYLSVGMQDLANKFNLSPTLAAVTLIAFANGAPDVLSSMSAGGSDEGAYISLGSLFGGFIFSATLVIANVIWNTPHDIRMPRYAVTKELGFYFLSVIIVSIFGLTKTAGYPFLVVYGATYVIYIVSTMLLEKYDKADELARIKAEEELGSFEKGLKNDQDDSQDDKNKLSINDSKAMEIKIDIKEEEAEEDEKEKGLFGQVMGEIMDDEASFIENIAVMPLLFVGLFTICYLDNPLMKFPFKFLVIGMSFFWMTYSLELLPFDPIVLLIVGLFMGVVFLVCEILKLSKFVLECTYELVSVFSAIGWISLLSNIIIDCISFLAFYFSINKVILSSLLLSAGNTVGDYFANAALAKQGEAIMGAVASYSG